MPSVYELSDDEIMNMSAPPVADTSATEERTDESTTTTVAEGNDTTTVEATTDAVVDNTQTTEVVEEEGKDTQTTTDIADGGKTTVDGGTVVTTGGEQAGNGAEVNDKTTSTEVKVEVKDESTKDQSPDYKAFYEGAMAPIKANGKTVEIKSPEDLRTLAQMGLNYTQKMQAIAPVRKIGMMLQDHGLLDESKLSFLIDLHNKKPEAIRQLIKDAGIDPLEIDTSADTGYTQSNHAISTDEHAFRSKVMDLKSTPEGQATIDVINSTWDDASKNQLYQNPDVADVITTHRASGIYDRVAGEVQRMAALGQIPAGTSFLSAYQAIGKHMGDKGELNDLIQPQQEAAVQAQVVEKKPIATKVVVAKPNANAQQVAAATQSTSTAKKAETKVNPLDMSDAAFEAELKRVRGY